MAKFITLQQPDIDSSVLNYTAGDLAQADVVVPMKNTLGFAVNDLVVLNKIGYPQTEIVQIASVDSPTQITLVSGCKFPHSSGSTVTQIPYNQFRVYRSLTGVGGSYTLLATLPLEVSELTNFYRDPLAQSPYSYQMSFYNSVSAIESTKSDEIPFTGYPDWSLKAIQDSVLGLFGDTEEEFITRDMITGWANDCYRDIQNAIQSSESPYDITSSLITSTGAESYDISLLQLIGLYRIDYSTDGGVTFPYTIYGKDFRMMDNVGSIGPYDFRLGGNLLFINGSFPAGYIMRLWFTTIPVNLSEPTDVLKDPFKSFVSVFINYCLMRAHEKDRKMTELASYYGNKVDKAFTDPQGIVSRIRARIKQPYSVASTWEDDYGTGW